MWLCINKKHFAKKFGRGHFPISYEKLVHVLSDKVGHAFHASTEIVATHIFGSYAHNFDQQDDLIAQERLKFFNMLETRQGFITHIYPVNFHGKRMSRTNRPGDDFVPQEKCVDVALATELVDQLHYDTFDAVVVVAGDRDFVPPIHKVLDAGKRVVLATIQESCASVYYDHGDPLYYMVSGIYFMKLEDFAHEFYNEPQGEFALLKDGEVIHSNLKEGTKVGKILHVAPKRPYGFIEAVVNGTLMEYHFSEDSIANGTPFGRFTENTVVAFCIASSPGQQAGHAVNVRILDA